MKFFISTILACLIVITIFLGTNIRGVFDQLIVQLGQIVKTINNFRLSDDERIRLSQSYSILTLKQLALFLLILFATLFALIGANYLLHYWKIATEYQTLAFITGFSVSFLVLIKYYTKKNRYYYSPSKKLFYYLTLGIPGVQKIFNKLQGLFVKKNFQVSEGVIITGLARAGTTTLLQTISSNSGYKSFTYRAMPILMAARWWSKVNRAKSKKQERIHEDGIKVDLDSPEAFDEYFWRIILKEKYYTADSQLRVHDLDEIEIEAYEGYAGQILNNQETYLSKNNNFILRLNSFLKHRKNYKILIVFREPVSHIYSLYYQHQNMKDKQSKAPFIKDYMDWLGHHEFGLNIKEFKLNDREFKFNDSDALDYWLERWINYYEYSLSFYNDCIFFVSNEQIGAQPDKILKKLGYEKSQKSSNHQGNNESRFNSSMDRQLLKRAFEVYYELKLREF